MIIVYCYKKRRKYKKIIQFFVYYGVIHYLITIYSNTIEVNLSNPFISFLVGST